MDIKPCTFIELNGEYHIVDETTQTYGSIDSLKTIPLRDYIMKYHLVSIEGSTPTTIEAYLEETAARLIVENPMIHRNKK